MTGQLRSYEVTITTLNVSGIPLNSMKTNAALRLTWIALLSLSSIFPSSIFAQSARALAGAKDPKPQMSLNNRDRQYKRIHQYALRLILLLRFEEAKTFLQDHLKDFPSDAESHYLMGVWHARQTQTEQAADWFRRAIELGLPSGRIAAGPKGLLRNINLEHPFFRALNESHANTLIHGPLVGSVTSDSASFWVRTANSSLIQIEASTSPEFTDRVIAGNGRTRSDADMTAVIGLRGLTPQSTYYYRVKVNGESTSTSGAPMRFRTYARKGLPTKLRLAFGGGAGFVPSNERAWLTIGSFDPDMLMLLGDNVYIDDPESIIMQRYTYHRRQSRPEWRELTKNTPVFTIWDDHDFSTNDSWGGPMVDEPFWKPHFAYRTFRENWANPAYGFGDEQPGCWYQYSVGDIDFVMLDCRYYRTNPRDEKRTILGPVQMQWLKKTLRSLDGTFKVLVSSVPWDFRTKGDSLDTWNGYKTERNEIFDFLTEHSIEGVVLMSADRHRSDAWRIDRPGSYSLYEFNSSRLTNQHVHQEMTDAGALFSYNKKQSFGIVEFDTTKEDPTVAYTVVTIDGEAIHNLKVRRSMLGATR